VSKLTDSNTTIYEALQNIQNGKYVMPAFQRQYVWNMEQIEKLWDSILSDYPISTFLFWYVDDSNVTDDTQFCRFRHDVSFNSSKIPVGADYKLEDINTKITNTGVLDGQQRLTSLFLSLFGDIKIYPKGKRSYETFTKLLIELNKNKISIDEDEYNSKKFDIRFCVGNLSPTQFEIKNVIDRKFQNEATRENAIDEAIATVPADSKDYARNILQKLYKKIFEDPLVRYTEIKDMNQDDALEMFVRFNSGGKVLKKAEITMSILTAYWFNARTKFGEILVDSYAGFDTDFIIRTALMLYGDVIKSNINRKIAETLKNDWNEFKSSLIKLEKLLKEMKIEVSRFSSSWNVLLPIIYYIYYNPEYKNNTMAIRAYLLRAIFFTYFQSGTTAKLQQMKSRINDNKLEITIDMLNNYSDLRVTDGKIDDILNVEKGSRVAGEVLYYLSLDWLNKNFHYEQDHLHPDNGFDMMQKPISISTENWIKWRSNRNRLPNIQLLVGRANASKSDMRLIDYYNDMDDKQKEDFHNEAIIPIDISLKIEDFENFYEARKKMLAEKIRDILA